MTSRSLHRLWPAIGLGLLLGLALTSTIASAQGSQPPAPPAPGYYYIVRPGDSWLGLSWRTGLSVADLKAANPTAVRPRDWLWTGERLYIPIPAIQPDKGYWYQVRPGDNWYSVAASTGVSTLELWRANPMRLYANRWIYAGDWLWVPTGVAPAGASVAPTATLTATAPLTPTQALTPAVALPLTVTHTLTPTLAPTSTATRTLTPTLAPTPTATRTLTPTLAPTPTATRTLTPTAMPTLAPSPTRTQVATASPTATQPTATPAATASPTAAPPTATRTAIPTASPTAPPPTATQPPPTQTATQPAPTATATPVRPSPTATRPAAAGCPAGLGAYADEIAAYLNKPGNDPDGLAAWLTGCGALTEKQGAVVQAAIQSPVAKDRIVALRDPATDEIAPRGLLLVYHQVAGGYRLARKAEGAGQIALLRAGDINADGKAEIAWTDTTCGAHTCFSTLRVEQWDGQAYRSWVVGEPTMAYAEYAIVNSVPGGSGDEITAHGGMVASAGAGPQRAWTETYVSVEGQPYQLYSLVYDQSSCLYHHILDANRAFGEWQKKGFAAAIQAYQTTIDDQKLQACGSITDESVVLRDFARFRLVVAYIAAGKSSQSPPIRDQISYAPLVAAANAFLDGYRSSGSIIQACRDTNFYATTHPDAWQFLADWGYANPTFSAQDLCPLG